MKAYFNGSWVENKVTLPLNDRALQFGDGVFETMIYQHGKINYINDHLKRLHKALEILKMNPFHLSKVEIVPIIKQLLIKNEISGTARIKLLVWRKGQKQRAYATSDKEINYLIVTSRCDPIDLTIVSQVGYSATTRNYENVRSSFKSLSSLHYVTAALERDDKGLDELILLDQDGNLSECIAANLFWIKGDKIFTPSLSTGCINGIMRQQLIKWCQDLQIDLVQSISQPKSLKSAEYVFCLNVAGVTLFDHIGTDTYAVKGGLIDLIIERVLDPDYA
ncbi:MAG: aminotransferase class IV [Bacteroidota bacterium]